MTRAEQAAWALLAKIDAHIDFIDGALEELAPNPLITDDEWRQMLAERTYTNGLANILHAELEAR